jgi:hypothetical protein
MTKSTTTATDGMQKSTYGQEYLYTKTELINNQLQTISSGVAQWEPSIGGEENPHREMINYFNKNNMGPYDFATVELPLAEMLFPSPSVGYSKVTVKSINNEIRDASNNIIGKVKNAASIQVTDYYTAREFPTKSNYTPLEEHGASAAVPLVCKMYDYSDRKRCGGKTNARKARTRRARAQSIGSSPLEGSAFGARGSAHASKRKEP